ncbi:PHD finger protein ALFIN-LIKE 1-like [Oryza brachyantha]|uniref:PHD finger protein ALFIN-LIKE 1-like n=1 Tax=Oryza brachyantha TaxID=4533 RepID=UPI001ADAC6D7|nr:PHD finger protein ALFIN-LIKE 1-like [Oryza brachyantha]
MPWASSTSSPRPEWSTPHASFSHLRQRPLQPSSSPPPRRTAGGEELGLVAPAAAAVTMDPASGRNPRFEAVRSIDDIFKDFIGRRTGIVRAFTEDLEAFTAQCKPDLDGLCLYGYANGTWEVAPPAQHVPTELPEPTVGINIPRDTMYKRDWVALLTVFSDSWLLAVAFFHGARLNLDREGRVRLFDLINSVPTVYESVFGVKKSREQRHPFQRKKNSADGDDDGAIFLRKRDDGEIYLRKR